MARQLKRILYFSVARYFRAFARIRLTRWKPRVVVITGSNGKTTALALAELALGSRARYSHGANSSFGIPFDILGLARSSYSPLEWLLLALRAPLHAWKQPPQERIYVVEADSDRPGEGAFLAALLHPEVTVWLSSARTHSMNFDKAARHGSFGNVESAIAHEFGNFLAHTGKLAIVNADNELIMSEARRTNARVETLEASMLERYAVTRKGSEFDIAGTTLRAPYLLPEVAWYAIAAARRVAEYFGVEPSSGLSALRLPPGRSSLLRGVKDTTIVDSTYNANAASVAAILDMSRRLPGPKWLVLGDMTEQGMQEREEHEQVARLAASGPYARVVLVGPRMRRYALPLLQNAVAFDMPREALDYLRAELKGGETVIFKGARFLEGVVEHLLADPHDVDKLCRREAIWRRRRVQWGL